MTSVSEVDFKCLTGEGEIWYSFGSLQILDFESLQILNRSQRREEYVS